MKQREQLKSRLGFILISAGCAVGMGNVWRFPYVTGQYGGGAFVLLYLIALIGLSLAPLVMEFAVGRAGGHDIAHSFKTLRADKKWYRIGYVQIFGNVILMLFYTTLAGWCLSYISVMARGQLSSATPDEIGTFFGNMLSRADVMIFWMSIALFVGILVCSIGLQKGVERVSKFMMIALFGFMGILVVRSLTLPNAMEGIKFYLIPDFSKMFENGIGGFIAICYAAIGQAFFTLSLGQGGMAIFGSYIDKKKSLTGESIIILALDCLVAILAGLIIFPATFSFGIDAGGGAGLAFVTLPNLFNAMPLGQFWGIIFFVFLSMAALTTIIGVLENIYAFIMEQFGFSRNKTSIILFAGLFTFSIPTALGFNLWSSIEPLGAGTNIMDLLDFIVSNNILPLGALVTLFFCTRKFGWGWDNFLKETNTGDGIKFANNKVVRFYVSYIIPLIMLFIFVYEYVQRFILSK